MASHKCTNSQSRTQHYLCLVVGYPSLYPLGLVTVILLVCTRAITQAPRIVNPSEKSLSKFTFGGLKEILGCMWGVPPFRWTQRDIPLKSVSHPYTHFPPLWTDLLNTSFAVVRSTSTDKIMAVFNEVSFGLSLHGRPAGLLMKQQNSELQAEKRGNFVVVGCIEGSKVVSWSLNVSIILY